jgi:Subtilisin inhibitor-like
VRKVALVLLLLAALQGVTVAGAYAQPPADTLPARSPGDALALETARAGHALAVVNGQPRAALTITVWPNGREAGAARVRTLRCSPAGGTLPRPGVACRRLAALQQPFTPVPPDVVCTQVFAGPQEALVTGTFLGRKVWARFNRRNGCQTDRWNRHAFLFAA